MSTPTRMYRVDLGTTGISISVSDFFSAGSIGAIGAAEATEVRPRSDQGKDRLDEAVRLGVRVVDTAGSYGGGTSERTVGEWLHGAPPRRCPGSRS